MLVELGKVDVNITNSSNNTALHIAAKNGLLEICKYLVEHAKPTKSDVLIKGLDAETAREAANDMGNYDVGKYMGFHERRMRNWRNRNCLLKLFLSKTKTTVFKGYTLGIFKEIIKYA